jgi:hypothetical protein
MRFLFFFLFVTSFVWSQLPTSPNNGIPDDWLGSYEGVMEIYNNNGLQQKIGVNFDLQVMDRPNYWTYNMSYINLKDGEVMSTKAYKIFYAEETKKLWLDEGDSLLIEMTHLGNCFYDHFELSDMFFNSSLCKQNENLIFELTGGQKKPTYTSPYIKEVECSVETLRFDFLQSVLLKPKK